MSEPKKGKKQPREEYDIATSQEADAIMRAASDGKSGRHWNTNENAIARIHKAPGASHHIRLVLTDGEREAGVALDALTAATEKCDAAGDFILLYVTRRLMPTAPLPDGTAASAVIELDDVIKAIGWYPQSTVQRQEMRERVWHFLKFGASARIVGQRTYTHRDTMTGEVVDTYIDSPPWMLGSEVREGIPQPSLFETDAPPLRVQVVATDIWTQLTTRPDMAQFLPLGEVLGAIPGAKPSGAWARVIGLALSNFWRRKPRETMNGELKPTRRELLERYTPETGAASEVLGGRNPQRAIEYWAAALRILVECDFVADEGEAALSYEAQRDVLPFRLWQEDWLNGTADLRPGGAMIDAIGERVKALPASKPRKLSKPQKRAK